MSNNCLPCAECLENCDDTFACIDQYITNIINETINSNFCTAVIKCVEDNLEDLELCPIVQTCLTSIPGYTDTGTVFLTTINNVLTWVDLTSIGTDVTVESGNCINVSGTGSSIDPLIFDLDEACVHTMFSAGTCLVYNSFTGEFSIDEDCVQDLMGITFIDTTTVNFTYDDDTDTVIADVNVSADLTNDLEIREDGLYVNVDPQPSELVYGGVVSWVQDYDFHVTAAGYYLNDIFYEAPAADLTLSPSDPALDRFDVIYVDADGIIKVLEGVPSEFPAQPGLDLGLQLGLGVILVKANTTQPVEATEECAYIDNSEWTATASDASINVASVTTPCSGSFSIEGTTVTTGDYFRLVRGSSTPLSPDFNILHFLIRSKGAWGPRKLNIQFYNAGVSVGSLVAFGNNTYTFASSNVVDCQFIAIDIIDFNVPISSSVDEIRFTMSGNNNIGFFIDNVCIQNNGTIVFPQDNDIHNQYFGPQTPGDYWIYGNAQVEGWFTSPQRVAGVLQVGSEKFGWASSTVGTTATAVGYLARAEGQEGATALGNQSFANVGVAIGFGSVSNRGVAVGGSQTVSGGTAVGWGSNSNALSSIAVGASALASGTGSVTVGYGASSGGGYGAVAIGSGASAVHAYSGAFGVFATTTATKQLVIGGDEQFTDMGFNSLYFGSGVTSPFNDNRFWSITGAEGNNTAGGNWTIAGSAGTGSSSTGSRIIFQTSDAGASGSTAQTLSNKVEIVKTGALIFNKYGINTFAGVPTYTLGVDASGNVIEYTPGFGSGSVTSFSSGNLSPLFTTSVATATTTPALSFALTNAAGGTVFGNSSSVTAAPLYTTNPVLGRVGSTGSLGLSGTVSGTVTIRPQSSAGTYNFNLPISVGPVGWVLTSQGGGATAMTWTDPGTFGGGGGGVTANNGITENIGDNVQWGGTLVHDTTVEQDSQFIAFTNNGFQTFISDPLNEVYQFGDINVANSGSSIMIDDSQERFLFSTSFGRFLDIDNGINIYSIGDIDGFLFQSFFEVNGALQTQRVYNSRFQQAYANGVVSANDLTLSSNGNTMEVTGSTTINAITTAEWQPGSWVILEFIDAPLLLHDTVGGPGTATLKLAGSADYQAAAGDTLMLEYNGTNWRETGRSIALGGPGILTVDNGLTLSEATNAQWGGTLIHATDIAQAGYPITFSQGIGRTFYVDPVNQAYQLGDIDNIMLGSSITVDDAQERFVFSSGSTRALDINKGINTYSFGDIDSSLFNSYYEINDAVQTQRVYNSRFEQAYSEETSAAGDLVLAAFGNTIPITGGTTINAITITNWQAGSWIVLEFGVGAPLVKHNTAGGANTARIKLAGSVDFQTANGDTLMLEYNGVDWKEVGRSIAAVAPFTGITADNGLTENVANNVQLGGTLLQNTTVTNGAFTMTFDGAASLGLTTLKGIATVGNAVEGVSADGIGVTGQSTTGLGGYFVTNPSSTNTIADIVQIRRTSSGTVANGIGGALVFQIETSLGSTRPAGTIVGKFTEVTDATRTSQLDFTAVNSAAATTIMSAYGTGVVGIGISSSYTATRLNIVDNAVGAASIVDITSTSTAAASNLQKGINISLSGANATASQTTYGLFVSNSHSGTTPVNYGIYSEISNDNSNSYAVRGQASAGIAVLAYSATGLAVWGNAGSSTAITGTSVSGLGFNLSTSPASTNSVVSIGQISRLTSGTAANGIGGSLDFNTQDSIGSNNNTNKIISKWTDATFATRTSEFSVTGLSNAATLTLLTLSGNGAARLNQYGTGAFTGTEAYRLAVTSSGDIVEKTATQTKGLFVEYPSNTESVGIWQTPVAITVSSIKAVLVGSATPSLTMNIAFGTDRTSGTNVFTAGQVVTSTTTGHTFNSGFNDATIPAGSFIWFTTSAQSGTVVQIELTVNFTED